MRNTLNIINGSRITLMMLFAIPALLAAITMISLTSQSSDLIAASTPLEAAQLRTDIEQQLRIGHAIYLERDTYAIGTYMNAANGEPFDWPAATIERSWIMADKDGNINHYIMAKYTPDGQPLAMLNSKNGVVTQITENGSELIDSQFVLDQRTVEEFLDIVYQTYSRPAKLPGAPAGVVQVDGRQMDTFETIVDVNSDGTPDDLGNVKHSITYGVPDHNPFLQMEEHKRLTVDGRWEPTKKFEGKVFSILPNSDLDSIAQEFQDELQAGVN